MKETSMVVNGSAIQVMESDRDESWRLVHDGESVLFCEKSSGVTTTKNVLFEGTFSECIAEINRLDLSGAETVISEYIKSNAPKGVPLIDYAIEVMTSLQTVQEISSALESSVATALSSIAAKQVLKGGGTIVKP